MSKPLPREDLDHILTQAGDAFTALAGARIFITGGTGFFGHWLLESLLHANRELSLNIAVTVLTRSVATFRATSTHIANDPAITPLEGDVRSFAFPAQQHTHILHAATDSGGQQVHLPPYALAESILEGTRRVLQFARATQATRLLYTSSGAVYGRSTTLLRTPETYAGAPDPLLLQSSYDEAKRMSEHLCIAYAAGTGLEPVIARCFAFVGPHLPLDQHFAIGNFIGAALAGQPIHIRGDGTPRRSWLYMSDLSIWLWTMLARGNANRAYNVGSDEAYTIAEAARLVREVVVPFGICPPEAQPKDRLLARSSIQVDGTPDPLAPLNSYVPAIDRARDELGLCVIIPLDEALRRTAAWYT
jgi:dTDP-glucose 4,6-dehydratase